MSGISEIKKKTKLSIDEMYDNQSVGKLVNHLNVNTVKNPTIQQPSNPTIHPSNNQANHMEAQLNGPAATPTKEVQQDPNNRSDLHLSGQAAPFSSSKSQSQKVPTYKMTFNLTDAYYKLFNDLYAKRMLQGRKTEKSDLICEAIDWLIKMEGDPN